jgi:hypothetical protein
MILVAEFESAIAAATILVIVVAGEVSVNATVIISVIIRGSNIFPLSGTFFSKTEKAEKFFEIFFFNEKKFFSLMNKNSKKK